MLIILFSAPTFGQDNKPINNKGKIKQTRAKSVKKKEKGSTKDIAGKRLRTKNTNSVAGRAVYSYPSPYANERRAGKDRPAKSMDGRPLRIRSRSAESARNNVYPQNGPFVNQSSKRTQAGQSNRSQFTRSGKLSKSRSAESSRSNVYPQKGPFVNRSSKNTERVSAGKNRFTRTGKLSTNARTTKNIPTSAPRSRSTSAESTKGKRFQQTGPFVNRASRSTETAASGSSRYTRRGKLSAGPNPPGKKRTVTPRSASQQYVTRGKKDVYWGKFSKGEKAITTDISGNPLRRRNYRTPPNEIIKPKDPYAGRKKSSGDRAYSGTFRSGNSSASRRSEKAWIGDVSGQPIRKRASRQTEVAGKRTTGPAGGSISASGKYRSNQPFRSGGGSISASEKYRSNQPFRGGGGSISASGKYRSNQPFNGRQRPLSISNQNRTYSFKRNGGGSISAAAKYRSNEPFNGRQRPLSVSNQNRTYSFKPNGGGSISAAAKYRSNKPFDGRAQPLSVSGQNRIYRFKPNGGGSMSGKIWNNNNQPISAKVPGIGASAMAQYQKKLNPKRPTKTFSQGGLNFYKNNGADRARRGNMSASEESPWNNNNRPLEKSGGSMSGKLWNNNAQPIPVRIPTGAHAADVGYSGRTKLPFFRRTYVRNPNAVEKALKKESPYATVYMADGLQVPVKAKQTSTKPKAVKGSMPGLAPSKATVKASEYSSSMKVYWKYKHNPSSADEALKTIAPGRAYARIVDYQGNVKMVKYNDKRFLPDAKFAHGKQNNVKQERTIMTDFKLLWTKIFKKNGTQPNAVKEKSVRPRYDKRERELWPGLYD